MYSKRIKINAWILFFSDCEIDDTQWTRNIGYVLSGYDIYHGNPLVTRPASIDPGLRLPIFKASYEGSTTQDQEHCVPEGMSVLDCAGTCNFYFSTTIIRSTKTYNDTLQIYAGVTGKTPGGSFGASADFKHVNTSTESKKNIFTQSETSCCVYSALLKDAGHPQFDVDFLHMLNDLTDVFNPEQYFR